MNKANSGGKGFHPATICIFWKKGNQWQNKTYKQYSQQVNSAIYIYFNALLPGILCIPRIHITSWNHTAHLSWAAVPPRGKVCMKYSDMRNPICRGLTAGFLGEMGKCKQPRASAERTAFLILLIKMVVPISRKGGLFFTLNPAAPVLLRQHLDRSWDSNCLMFQTFRGIFPQHCSPSFGSSSKGKTFLPWQNHHPHIIFFCCYKIIYYFCNL